MKNTRFWILMIIFQLAFGLAVFGVTRNYYLDETASVATEPVRHATPALPAANAGSELENLISSVPAPAVINDPAALSRQADELFSSGQYTQAAELYQRLIVADPGNANTYNNLGLTLHYLGRSNEALNVLNQGVSVDPNYQRIWLTLGFVNSQSGNRDQARTALNHAVQLGADSEVGQSAQHMLDSL